MLKALHSGSITLYPINEDNLEQVKNMFSGYPDSPELLFEIEHHYRPEYEDGKRMKYGFYAVKDGKLAGMSLLGIDEWATLKGYTGADTLLHMRGQGIAPDSKPHLFYFAFEVLGLNRLATGCLVSNTASKRSIEKTAGFQFEGISRESGLNDKGELEDEYLYAILKSDWLKLYDKTQVSLIDI